MDVLMVEKSRWKLVGAVVASLLVAGLTGIGCSGREPGGNGAGGAGGLVVGAGGDGGSGASGGEGGAGGTGGGGGEGGLECEEWIDGRSGRGGGEWGDWDEVLCVDHCCTDWYRAPECDGDECACAAPLFDLRECGGPCLCPGPRVKGERCDPEEGWVCDPKIEEFQECPNRMCTSCEGFGDKRIIEGCECECVYRSGNGPCYYEGLRIECRPVDDPPADG